MSGVCSRLLTSPPHTTPPPWEGWFSAGGSACFAPCRQCVEPSGFGLFAPQSRGTGRCGTFGSLEDSIGRRRSFAPRPPMPPNQSPWLFFPAARGFLRFPRPPLPSAVSGIGDPTPALSRLPNTRASGNRPQNAHPAPSSPRGVSGWQGQGWQRPYGVPRVLAGACKGTQLPRGWLFGCDGWMWRKKPGWRLEPGKRRSPD